MNDPKSLRLAPLRYPVFVIEDQKRRGRTTYQIVRNPRDFTTFSRLPEKGRYSSGKVFASNGVIFDYNGESGWPRFDGLSKTISEALVLPAIFSKLAEGFFYFGPILVRSHSATLEEFKEKLLESMCAFEKNGFSELEQLIQKEMDFKTVLEAVDWYRHYGGKRDMDGHLV